MDFHTAVRGARDTHTHDPHDDPYNCVCSPRTADHTLIIPRARFMSYVHMYACHGLYILGRARRASYRLDIQVRRETAPVT